MAIHKCPHCSKPFELEVRFIKAPEHQAAQTSKVSASTDDIGELLDAITDDDQLDGKAAEFVGETRKRYAQYKDRIKMSDKQMAWLKRIAAGEFRKDDWN